MPVTNYDPTTPEHKRRLVKVLLLVLALGAFGGTVLGYKISAVEEATAQTLADGADHVAQPSPGNVTAPLP